MPPIDWFSFLLGVIATVVIGGGGAFLLGLIGSEWGG